MISRWSWRSAAKAAPALSLSLAGMLTVAMVQGAGPAAAALQEQVVPVDGKWAGLRSTTVCTSLPAEDTSPSALPSGRCATENIQVDDEDVMFTLRNRYITSMSFDIPLQCRASDVNVWTPLTMTYRATSDFGYSGLNGSSRVPVGGRLRIAFPIEDSPLMYPDGTVRATFDFRRGPKPEVSIFYSGREVDAATGVTTTCVSDQNRPTIIAVQRIGG